VLGLWGIALKRLENLVNMEIIEVAREKRISDLPGYKL